MKQLTVLTENKPGVLADIATVLGKKGVSMESISAETFSDSAVIRLVTKDANSAMNALSEAAYNVKESDVFVFKILDRAGELGKVARMLSMEGINVENIYLLTREEDYALLALKVNNDTKTKEKFAKYIV